MWPIKRTATMIHKYGSTRRRTIFTPAQYMMALLSLAMYTRGLMRVDVCGDFRAGVSYTVALTVQTHDLGEVRPGFPETENFCSFHGEFLLSLGNLANPFIYTVNRGHLWGRKDAMFCKFNRQEV